MTVAASTHSASQSVTPSTALRAIEIYDTTLRDGSQGEGISFSLQDKLNIAQRLAEIGIDYIEGGYPLSNEKDVAFFQQVKSLKLGSTLVSAFGMTRRRSMKACDDPGMKAMVAAATLCLHDRRQDLGFPSHRCSGCIARREPRDDRREHRVSGRHAKVLCMTQSISLMASKPTRNMPLRHCRPRIGRSDSLSVM